ncbi:MAG: S-layer homology domain-containing protein [Syntrophomonadaceae bacterium]|nr:S-layer homology domain-containing protein [Syntrophomonadaceae bacterium]
MKIQIDNIYFITNLWVAPAADGAVKVNYTSVNGTAVLSLPAAKVKDIIDNSQGGAAVIDLSKVSGITAAQLPKAALSAMNEAGLDITLKLPAGTITLDEDAAASILEQASGSNLSIELQPVATGSLTPAQQEAVRSGDLVLDINILSGTQKISSFDGTLSVQVAYNGPQPVAVWYLNDKGDLEKVNCTFKDGKVSFDLDHLSLYVVGQDTKEAAQEKPITNVQEPGWENPFSDVLPGAWYYDAVSFIAAKGITSGTTATTFSPDATLTRGQFITLLMRAYDIKPNTNNNDNFSDAGNTYYTEYLATAKQLGLTKGIGDNKYAPEQAVTRQEMFTLLYNALKSLDKLPTGNSGKTLADFTDGANVASWAGEAMGTLVKSGTISGSSAKLTPDATTTRAEMTQVLYNLLAK